MSRFCIGLKSFDKLTTLNVVNYLDILISKYGKPRQIISDNGNVNGLRSKTLV